IGPHGELLINHAALQPVKEIQQNYTPLTTDRIILVKTTTGDITITLPNPVNHKGKKYTIKKEDTNEDYYINVTGNIAGLSGQTLYTALPYSGWDFVSDGSQWIIVNKI